jgi:hypothetical protein
MDFLNLPYLTAKNMIRSFSDDLFFSLIDEVRGLYPNDILHYYSNINNVKKRLENTDLSVFLYNNVDYTNFSLQLYSYLL